MLVKDYFTKVEIVETIQNAKEYTANDFYDLCEAMFNRDYYSIGKHEAAQALETYRNDEKLDGYETNLKGTVGAIVLVERYELDQFGTILTPLFDDPEKLANMVEYIRGKRLFGEALSKANLGIDSETTKQSIKKFIKAAKRL